MGDEFFEVHYLVSHNCCNHLGTSLFLQVFKLVKTNLLRAGSNFIIKNLKKILPEKFRKISSVSRTANLNDFTSIVFKHKKEKTISLYNAKTFQSDLMLKKNGLKKWEILWQNGSLKNLTEGSELLYYHFSLSQLKKSFVVEPYHPGIHSFILSESGITSLEK